MAPLSGPRNRWFIIAALAALCLAVCLACCQLAQASSIDATAPDCQLEAAQHRPKLFQLLNFTSFKRLFHKSYRSLVEELARQRLFLARAWAAFGSVLHFKSGQRSSYKSLNALSDWTPEERKRLLNQRLSEQPRRRGDLSSAPDVPTPDDESAEPEVRGNVEAQVVRAAATEARDIEGARDVERKMLALASAEAAAAEQPHSRSGSDESLKELAAGSPAGTGLHQARRKRETAHLERGAEHELPSVAELMGGELAENLEAQQVAMPALVPTGSGPATSGSKYRYKGVAFGGGGNLPSKDKNRRKPRRTKEAREVVYEIDHRACFNEALFQGDCGSCYVFATLSILEWHYCEKNAGKHTRFSQQFLLDCESQGSCTGGYMSNVFDFANKVGLQSATNWPYAEYRGKCPYKRPIEDEPEAATRAPYWKVANLEHYQVEFDQWDEELKRGPMAVTLATEADFSDYGGGVDEHAGCKPGEDMHAMVLVGKGREDGRDFWLLRNSYGADWGEQGYYKISRAGMARCVWSGEDAAIQIEASRLRFRENRAYDADRVGDFISKREERRAAKAAAAAAAA